VDRRSATFRPIGVPAKFSMRASEPSLTRINLREKSCKKPVLLVLVKDHLTKDGRIGVDWANPPTAPEIQARMERWWQLNSRMKKGQASPDLIPSVLIAVSGAPKHRIVVGSLAIDRKAQLPWESRKGGLSRVPVIPDPKLDFAQLRGRRIRPDLGKFGRVRAQFFKIV
jgi:hypothetical protein